MNMIVLTQEEFNALFEKYPQVRKAESGEPCCPYCSNGFSPKNLEYYNSATEWGTPYCTIEIACDICYRIIWRGASWYPEIDDEEELRDVTQEVLDELIESEG